MTGIHFQPNRIKNTHQILISTGANNENPLTKQEQKKLTKIIQNSFKNTQKIAFQESTLGRGAAGASVGLDLSNFFEKLQNADAAINISKTVLQLCWNLINQIKKTLKKDRRVIYSKQFIEHHCLGLLYKNINEDNLNIIISQDLTGYNHSEYDYIDYYLFVFSNGFVSYIIVVNSSAEVQKSFKISLINGVETLKLKSK